MSIIEILTTTLNGLGQPAPDYILQTLLLKDGHFIGHKYRYDGGYAILPADSNTIEFFDQNRELLTTATTEASNEAAA
ncbi:MAG: hypothetical protein ABFC88_13205 [Thermoguttaceae bacterium]